ncbi:hypothetical protein KQX54_008033 [Cotesia glomerata]|uniref:Uncharacterized protein n=1 Tax=Cotesia glomerata TaxID=32391 RepID=A0AAV7IKN6_COTGL|nr:hypothetical protein KQX54_008033 [Cotesia glomerata]
MVFERQKFTVNGCITPILGCPLILCSVKNKRERGLSVILEKLGIHRIIGSEASNSRAAVRACVQPPGTGIRFSLYTLFSLNLNARIREDLLLCKFDESLLDCSEVCTRDISRGRFTRGTSGSVFNLRAENR